MSLGRRSFAVVALLLGALSIAGAQDGGKPLVPLESVHEAPPEPEARAHRSSRRKAVEDPWEALAAPLDDAEMRELVALAEHLDAPTTAEREAVARSIKERFGARAAGPLLELAERDLDCERRFRERALFSSLVFAPFYRHAPHCGWLGIRWQGSSTERHYFAAHVVEAVAGEPAFKSGLLANDFIVKWNGHALEDQLDFIDHVQAQAPGTVAELTVERDGRDVLLRVTMGMRVDQATHLPDLPYPTFQRDMAQRQLSRWLEAWRKRR